MAAALESFSIRKDAEQEVATEKSESEEGEAQDQQLGIWGACDKGDMERVKELLEKVTLTGSELNLRHIWNFPFLSTANAVEHQITPKPFLP